MKLADYIRDLDKQEGALLQDYAQRCEVTVGYMRVHVLYARKDPRFRLLRALARESQGNVTLHEVLEHFGVSADEIGAPQQQAA